MNLAWHDKIRFRSQIIPFAFCRFFARELHTRYLKYNKQKVWRLGNSSILVIVIYSLSRFLKYYT